jgi:hypothetical protein
MAVVVPAMVMTAVVAPMLAPSSAWLVADRAMSATAMTVPTHAEVFIKPPFQLVRLAVS